MEISFPDDQMQRLFERRSSLEAEFGSELADMICRRMGILQEAKLLSAVPTCRPPECQAEKNGRWSVALGDAHRLAFQPLCSAVPAEPADIKQIEILGVISS